MNNFADDTTLYCTLARMLYDRLRKRLGTDVADKALNPLGMVLPYEQRSAAVRCAEPNSDRSCCQIMAV